MSAQPMEEKIERYNYWKAEARRDRLTQGLLVLVALAVLAHAALPRYKSYIDHIGDIITVDNWTGKLHVCRPHIEDCGGE